MRPALTTGSECARVSLTISNGGWASASARRKGWSGLNAGIAHGVLRWRHGQRRVGRAMRSDYRQRRRSGRRRVGLAVRFLGLVRAREAQMGNVGWKEHAPTPFDENAQLAAERRHAR